ncbi:hypothetical protein NKH77_17075 [Streptomyces sp. M19]
MLRVLVGEAAASARHPLWLLRLQCRPAAAARLGNALAARNDVFWVALHSGGAELMCTTTLPADTEDGTGVLPGSRTHQKCSRSPPTWCCTRTPAAPPSGRASRNR